TPRRTAIIEALDERDMLPAIVFIFSRAACDDAVRRCLDDGVRLTSAEQREEIHERCARRTEALPDDELRVLGYGPWIAGLEAGLASHHAGLIPAFREAAEECFTAGLLQVVFATETLALGINMPARSVVMERLTKVRAHGRSSLTSGEYAQLTGRAGRRGLDARGHAVVAWSPPVSLPELAVLATSPAPELTSSFRPSYNLAVNLVRRYRAEEAGGVLERSFAQFVSAEHHHALARRMERTLRLLERRGHVDVDAWRLTPRGALVAGIYHESDLLVAEALDDGLLDGLDPAPLAAVVSACSYEVRAGRARREPRPPRDVTPRLGALLLLAEDLRGQEEQARLPRTRLPDAGFAEVAWRWARGERLATVLERAELAPGDFVRNARQLIDLLRQLASAAPAPGTADAAGRAVTLLERGVVAASAVAGDAGAAAEPEDGGQEVAR
ncbi:MAG TPA: helicase-related protein, partial [Acidimicrobiales bacterium]|nr:helicase-related protein [Acidimicrobiales bacterium]